MITQLDRMPDRSLSRALAVSHGPHSVLLGVGMDGKPVMHSARIEEGGSPSLLLLGYYANEILDAISASLEHWHGFPSITDPTSQRAAWDWANGVAPNWADGTSLMVAARRNPNLTSVHFGDSRVYCREILRGAWCYFPRVQPGDNARRQVWFYTCRD